MATHVIITPGTGAVPHATEVNAATNMEQFIADAKVSGLRFVRVPSEDYGSGQFAFTVSREGFETEIQIQMPGIPLEQVRYLGNAKQNIWDFPRLYKDGASWVWKYAIIDEDDYSLD